MDAADLVFAGASRQAELVRSAEVSPRELVEACLARIERLDPQLNAFRVVYADQALAEADQAGSRRGAGDDRPLLGVPVAIKDTTDVRGDFTANGSAAHGGPADADAELVRRLRAAGAVVIGKTNLPELAICGFTESDAWGVTRNPWNPGRTPGGSSGGSGAAVAAGMVGLAHASDGAGSIRIPAANCGLFGLKPQRGRLPLEPDPDHWNGMSVNGCVSRTVADTALFLDVTADGGPEGGYRAALAPPGRLRVAVSTRSPLPGMPIGADSRGAVEATAELLRGLGHDVRRRDPSYGPVGLTNIVPRYLNGAAKDVQALANPERVEPRTRGFARLGSLYSDGVMRRVRAAERAHAARINRVFDEADVLLMPTVARPAVEVGRWEGRGAFWTLNGMGRVYPCTSVWNATGQPAAAVPAGFTSDGLPLSVQLVARANDEATLLSVSAQIEDARPWAERRPPVS